jgi:hypothetical protein
MKTTFTLMLVGIVISSCSRNSENRIVYPDGHPIPTAPQRIVIRSSDVSAESQRRTGPTPLLLGPEALHEVYKGVFADRLSDTNTFLFGPEESDELGGFRILKPSNPRGGFEAADPVMKRTAKLTSDYVFALRKFTASACKVLIDKEIQTPDNASNLLVEGLSPSIGKIDRFMTMLLGYKSATGIHRGIQSYKDAFTIMMSTATPPKNDTEKFELLKVSYNHLCVALTTDVRVYVR